MSDLTSEEERYIDYIVRAHLIREREVDDLFSEDFMTHEEAANVHFSLGIWNLLHALDDTRYIEYATKLMNSYTDHPWQVLLSERDDNPRVWERHRTFPSKKKAHDYLVKRKGLRQDGKHYYSPTEVYCIRKK